MAAFGRMRRLQLIVVRVGPCRGLRAFSVRYGEAVLFWGNRCRHYTVANDSGVTSVSFDFRFLFRRFYDPHMENIYGGPTAFLLGGYFDAVDGEGALDATFRGRRGTASCTGGASLRGVLFKL